jgi:hypothetical protein
VRAGVGEKRCAARERAVVGWRKLRDIPEQLAVAAGRHMAFRQTKGGVDGGRAIAPLLKQRDEVGKRVAVAVEFLDRAKIGEAEAFERGYPHRRARAEGTPWPGPAREVDPKESRIAHGAKVNGINPQANGEDSVRA